MKKILLVLIFVTSIVCGNLNYTLPIYAETIQEEELSQDKFEKIVGIWESEDEDIITVTIENAVINDQIHEIKLEDGADFKDGDVFKLKLEDGDELVIDSGKESLVWQSNDYIRSQNKDLVNYIKDKLTDHEPINLEQLLDVSQDFLLSYYELFKKDQYEENEIINLIYHKVAGYYEDLNLLQDKDYKDYLKLVAQLEKNSKWTLPLINTANPKDVLAWSKDMSESELLDQIQIAYDNYQDRRNKSGLTYLEPYTYPPVKNAENGQNALIDPFTEETAFNYIKKKEGYTDDIGVKFSHINSDGSIELTLMSKSLAQSGGSGTVDRILVKPDGTYYSLY